MKDLYESLEFNKIIELLEVECLGDLGLERIQQLRPISDIEAIERNLSQVREYRFALAKNDILPTYSYLNINEDLKMLDIQDYVLGIEALQRINNILMFTRDVFRFFTATRKETYPYLYELLMPVNFDQSLQLCIERVIDADGNIRSDASPELQRIRKKINEKQRELDKEFKNIAGVLKNKGWLTDNVESFRNGRRVLSVPSEHKRKIRGIIHDESATGKTAFIEPEGVIEINNDIFDLEQEERRGIYRILKDLSATLRPYTPLMRQYQDLVVEFDFIQAKARLAVRMKANLPRLKPFPYLKIKNGVHPLLWLKNNQIGKKTVPFELTLEDKNRLLVISGPNAGGKSVTLKSIGLIQIMLQSGLLVPVSEFSEMGIFSKIYVNIGDSQSLEDDLSTYSSHLHNMKIVLDEADDLSMVLIDEFGSGTDPKIGGAIAEGILKELNERRVFGVITTHYSNLKIFAFKNDGILNASMHFDQENLAPTYELKVGRPGSSYAFEIAEKVGLGKKVLHYARHRAGKNEKAVDELLVDLQRERKELEEQLDIMAEKQRQLDKLIKGYDEMHKEYEFKRKRLKLDIKEQELQQTQKETQALEKLVREIREQQNLEKAKALQLKAKEVREELSEKVSTIREEIYEQEIPHKKVKKGAIEVGDFVRMRAGSATGVVESIDKNKAVVTVGAMRMVINIKDLVPVNEPLAINSKLGIQTDINRAANFESKLDIRGLRMMEALKLVEEFVDQALVTNNTVLRIVHGKGDGVLRTAVQRKLKEYNVFSNIFHPQQNDGGDGVTLAEM